MAKRKINNKSRNIVDEIYYTFDKGYKHGLDLGSDGKIIEQCGVMRLYKQNTTTTSNLLLIL